MYPESARENGAVGEVDVLVTLSASGAVTQISIYHTSGNGALDQAAIRAARASSYSPEIINCQAAAGTYTFHASFSPRDSSR
jgi:TonB family protein